MNIYTIATLFQLSDNIQKKPFDFFPIDENITAMLDEHELAVKQYFAQYLSLRLSIWWSAVLKVKEAWPPSK